MKILTIEECREKGIECFSYSNGDYEYKDKKGFWHLIRDGVDLLEGKEATKIKINFSI